MKHIQNAATCRGKVLSDAAKQPVKLLIGFEVLDHAERGNDQIEL